MNARGRWTLAGVDPQERSGSCDHHRLHRPADVDETLCLLCGLSVEPVLGELVTWMQRDDCGDAVADAAPGAHGRRCTRGPALVAGGSRPRRPGGPPTRRSGLVAARAQPRHRTGDLPGASHVDITSQVPKTSTPGMVAGADLVVTLGREVVVEPVGGTAIVDWDTDEPSERGIEGIERMRLVRDDIAARIDVLTAELHVDRRPGGDVGRSSERALTAAAVLAAGNLLAGAAAQLHPLATSTAVGRSSATGAPSHA